MAKLMRHRLAKLNGRALPRGIDRDKVGRATIGAMPCAEDSHATHATLAPSIGELCALYGRAIRGRHGRLGK
jgi:hypothetical protein